MGILRRLLAWTNDDQPEGREVNRRTLSSQSIDEHDCLRPRIETIPRTLEPLPGLLGPDASLNTRRTDTLGNAVACLETPSPHHSPNRSVISSHSSIEVEASLQSIKWDGPVSDEGQFLDQVVDAFDEAFDTACGSDLPTHSDGSPGSAQNAVDEATVQDLFVQIAANYSKPVRNFIFELKRGTATKGYVELLRSSLHMIGNAAVGMGLENAAKRITEFDDILSVAQVKAGSVLNGDIRDSILDGYQELAEVLPDVFQIAQDQQKREDIIIKSLLEQVPGIGRVSLEKIYRAGLGSLEALFLANTEDLAAATSIRSPLCERIVERLQTYRFEIQERLEHDPERGSQNHLATLVSELRLREDELERVAVGAALDPELAAEKRSRRQRRQHCSLEIIVTLAELGEVELIHQIQRLSIKQRLKRLEDYLKTLDAEELSASVPSAAR